jgi:hypothetical protein
VTEVVLFWATLDSGRVVLLRSVRNAEVGGEGSLDLWTADGRAVARRAEGEYEIVETGERLRSADPHAP